MTNQELEQWAQSREVSFEIAKAIMDLCGGENKEMESIWNCTSEKQFDEIMEMAWNSTDEDELVWGQTLDRKDFNNNEGK